MSIGMVLLAGGVGKRMGRTSPKQFLLLGGKPLIIHVAEAISGIDAIGEIVVTCPADHIDVGGRRDCLVLVGGPVHLHAAEVPSRREC